jgi:hypothetical protein
VAGKDSEDDRVFARGNPWARALRPTVPDDEKAKSPVLYVLFGLLSLVLVTIFVAALVLPPMFTETLIVRGWRTQRYGMFAAGLLMATIYFLIIVSVGKKIMGRPRTPLPPDDDQPPAE